MRNLATLQLHVPCAIPASIFYLDAGGMCDDV